MHKVDHEDEAKPLPTFQASQTSAQRHRVEELKAQGAGQEASSTLVSVVACVFAVLVSDVADH